MKKLADKYPTLTDYTAQLPHPQRREGGRRFIFGHQKKSSPEQPLVSIITIVFNGEQHLETAIQSVLNQSYKNIEYLIIDGQSTDRSLEIIKKYERVIDYWVSEPDQGISDAFNKGIASASGEIIGLLNSDDWLSENQVEIGVKGLTAENTDFVFGNLAFHDEDKNQKFIIKGDPGYRQVIESRMPDLCHPTVLVRQKAYQQAGLFRLDFHYAMDYEWLLRLHKMGGKGKYLPEILGHMQLSGRSDTSFVAALREVRTAAVLHGQSSWTAHLLFLFRVVKGKFRRQLEKLGMIQLLNWLWKKVNRNYVPVE
jgi:glycosyltransferase involved in cell wall biosynthesis